MMRDVDGLTCHYDTPLITHHLMVALSLYLSDRAADLLFTTLLPFIHTIPSSACSLILSQFLLLLSVNCCLPSAIGATVCRLLSVVC